MKITAIRTTALSCKVDPPYASAAGMQGRRGGLLVEVETDSGIVGIGDSLRQALAKKNLAAAQAGALLEQPALRLLASDVVWDDSFKDPSKQVLRDQGVGDVRVPESNFVQSPDFFTAAGLGAVVTRLRGANVSPTVGGLHGTNIVSTKALPQGTELSTQSSTPQPVVAGTNLGFAVTIEDSGDSAEVHIPVTLTITNGTKDIVKTQTIAFINKKEQTTVTFRNIQLDSTFFGSQSTKVKVKVNPVPNEANTNNNNAEYSVIFSLPQ